MKHSLCQGATSEFYPTFQAEMKPCPARQGPEGRKHCHPVLLASVVNTTREVN